MSAAGGVPAIRFPEFSEEWQNKPLSDFIVSMNAGVSVNSGDRPAQRNEYGILKTSCVTNGIFDAHENKVVLEYNEISRLREPIKAGTIIISRMNTPALVGANALVLCDQDNLFLPDRLWAAKVKPNTSAYWLGLVMAHQRTRQKLSDLASGTSGSMKNISKVDVKAMRLLAPTLPEQQKIADFLGAVDARVGLLRRRRDALRAYKKGMMQRLFAQDLRFTKADGSPFPDWQEKRLGEITSEKFANGVFNDPQLVGSGYRLINVKDMFEGNQIALHSLHLVAIDEREFLKNRAEKGDIFFTRSSLVKEGIAYSNVLLEEAGDVTFDGHLIRMRPDQSICIPRFVAAQLRHSSLRRQFVARGKTGTMTTIGQEDISTVRIVLPHPEEQQKIADTLTAFDDKIDAVTAQVDAMLRFKKGLLQQMLV